MGIPSLSWSWVRAKRKKTRGMEWVHHHRKNILDLGQEEGQSSKFGEKNTIKTMGVKVKKEKKPHKGQRAALRAGSAIGHKKPNAEASL